MTKAQKESWRAALACIKGDFMIHGRTSGEVGFITKTMIGNTLIAWVSMRHPHHKNSLLNESYAVRIGPRGAVRVKRQGFSFGGRPQTWNGRRDCWFAAH